MSVKIGNNILLKGKTRHGKNRIQQHGSLWTIKDIRGDKMLLESEFKTEGPKHNKGFDGRWVHIKDDQNFFVENV